MKFKNKKAFTLIEVIVVIVIVTLLMMATYTPYAYYSNKAKVRVASKEISKVLYDTRNLAIHGLKGVNGNLSTGVYFDNSVSGNNEIVVYTFPHYYTGNQVNPLLSDPNIKIYKTYDLLEGIQIDSIGSKDKVLFFFNAITGKGEYSYYTTLKNDLTIDDIDIDFSFKGSTRLNDTITYITKTNIVDY